MVTVCSFQTAKLLFRRNNRIWCKGLVCKASSVASHQTRWYNKRILRTRDFSWIENYNWSTKNVVLFFNKQLTFWPLLQNYCANSGKSPLKIVKQLFNWKVLRRNAYHIAYHSGGFHIVWRIVKLPCPTMICAAI